MQSLHLWDFQPVHRVQGHASTGSKASGLGTKPPEAVEYLSKKTKFEYLPKNKHNSLWSFSPTSELRIISDGTSIVAKCCQQSTVTCQSHTASGFEHSKMMTGCDATCCAIY